METHGWVEMSNPEEADGGLVVVVCTSNVCVSPYVERRLARLLDRVNVTVTSRGLHARPGQRLDGHVVKALGLPPAEAETATVRQLLPLDLDQADLVVTATRGQRAEVVRLNPTVMARCFALLDLADLAAQADVTAYGPVPPGVSWVRHVAARLAARRGLVPPRAAEQADIADPTGKGGRAHAQMVREVELALPALASSLTPLTMVTSRRH